MTLLAILITLGIERFYRVLDEYRNLGWFSVWGRWVVRHQSVQGEWVGIATTLLILFVPLLIVEQLNWWMADGGWLPEMLFSVVVLVLSIGPRDLRGQVESILESWSKDDIEGGLLHAEGMLEGELPEDKQGVVRALTESVLIEANSRLFSVIFWFALFGPAAGLLVRLGLMLEDIQSSDDGEPTMIQQLNQLLAWPPAHIVAISYAMVGDFSSSFHNIREHAGDWSSNSDILRNSGLGAIRLEPVKSSEPADLQEVWDALEMVRRSEIVWVTFLALLILFGYGG
ncbi:MAG: regulatory signaling modulator protein AmpE [Gammaproteobacteria bacterium]|uniref:Regulatory signaling modulator protein AmpE n=1 Tax=Candidatus Thiopontia autotrophica TaxID=2841688 RepID=A0A8J6PAK3_9GAMM|nr:regulatory signaling modulator protein AmpE [Candidatus Thiopontia autotrophica]MBL6969228.1 regulatory signaling modulator protein AmpE [Gammaproteobacteria bacterium]